MHPCGSAGDRFGIGIGGMEFFSVPPERIVRLYNVMGLIEG